MGKLDDCWNDCGYKWDEWKHCVACAAVVATLLLLAVLLAAFGFVRHVAVSVDAATLTRFDLVPSSSSSPVTAFAYNLSLTVVVRNPNWAMSLKNTKPLEADLRFDAQQFDRVELSGKGEAHPAGKTRVYSIAVGATRSSTLGNAGEAEFRRENATGMFRIEVALAGEVRYTARYTKCKLDASCPLTLQLAAPGAGTSSVVFQKVKCKLAKPEKNC